MKQIFTIFLGITLCLCAKAQTLQLLANTAHEFGFVDATKTNFYTYNDISNTNPNAAANFELKKFDPATNTFSVYLTIPNNNNYASFKPLSIINGKCLFAADYTINSNYSRRNYFVYDGTNLDSIFTQYVAAYININTYTDITNQEAYFSVDTIGGNSGIYKTDFSKLGTMKMCSYNNYIVHGIFGIGSNVYFTDSTSGNPISRFKLYQLTNNGKLAIDSSLFMEFYKDEVNDELYIYKFTNVVPPTRSVIKINAVNQLVALPNAPIYALKLLGKVGNKLAFIPLTPTGIELYDLSSQSTSTIFKSGSTTEPSFTSPAILSYRYITTSNNHMYIWSGDSNKLWVTDGNTITELNHTLYTSNAFTFGQSNMFCNENWLLKLPSSNGQSSMIMYDPNANSSATCFQSSDPNLNCLFSSAHEVNNTTYILSKSNLYEITNCSVSTDLSQLNASKKFSLFPNPSTDKINIGNYVFESVEVYNQLGILVHKANNASTFSTAALAPGLYSAKMKIGNAIVARQFVKE